MNNIILKERDIERSLTNIDITENPSLLPERLSAIIKPYLECDSMIVLSLSEHENNFTIMSISILLL